MVRSCTTTKLNTYNPIVSGTTAKQKSTFTLTFPALTLSPATKYDGHSNLRVHLDIPQGTVVVSSVLRLTIITPCSVNIPNVACSINSYNPKFMAALTYTGT